MRGRDSRRWTRVWIAFRFLKGGQRSAFAATFVSVLGLTIGVCALTVTLAILTGFDREYKKSILGLSAHAVVLSADDGIPGPHRGLQEELGALPFVNGVARFVMREGMLAHRGKVSGVLIKGISTDEREDVSDLRKMLQPPVALESALGKSTFGRGIVGDEIARNLGVTVGETLQLLILGEGGMPRVYPLQIAAEFHSGMYEYDARFVFVTLDTAQTMFNMKDRITGLEVMVRQPDQIEEVSSLLRAKLESPLYLLEWKELNQNLFAALKLEKVVFFLLIVPLVVVGALTVVAALIMFMMERKRGIAMLRALGFARRRIVEVFLVQGILIGVTGISGGLGLGMAINAFLKRFPIIRLSPQIYFIDHLPIEVEGLDILVIVATSVFLCILATWIPAYQASRLHPSEVLRAHHE